MSPKMYTLKRIQCVLAIWLAVAALAVAAVIAHGLITWHGEDTIQFLNGLITVEAWQRVIIITIGL